MPIFILVIGIMLVAAGVNDKLTDLTTLVKGDFKSDGTGFQTWMIAILIAGAFGYYKPLRGISNGLLVLTILAIILTKNHTDVITKAVDAITGKKG